MKLILILILNILSPDNFFNYLYSKIVLFNIDKHYLSGKNIIFVEKRFNINSDNIYDNRFYSLDGKKEFKYEDLVHLEGEIIGIKFENYNNNLIIRLNNNIYIKTIYFPNGNNIKNFCLIDELLDIRLKMIGKNIWLNKFYKNRNEKLDLIQNQLSLSNIIEPNFKEFQEVTILDVIPYILEDQKGYDFFLKIKSKINEIGYIKYERKNNKKSNREVGYFNQNPFKNISNSIIKDNIKKRKISLNMTKFQAFVAWGKSEGLIINPYGEKIFKYSDNRFIKFDENNRIVSFQNF